MQDPYESVRTEMVRAMARVETAYARWRNTKDSQHLEQQQKQLLDSIASIELDLTDLGDSVKVITNNRHKFAAVTDDALASRVQFIESTRARLLQIKAEALSHQASVASKEQARKPAAKAKPMSSYAALQDEPDPQQFFQQHMQVQAELEQEQEVVIDELTGAVIKVKEISKNIGLEVKLHDKVIEDIGAEMNTLQGRLKKASRDMEKALAEANQKTKICCIVVLIVVLLVVMWLFFIL